MVIASTSARHERTILVDFPHIYKRRRLTNPFMVVHSVNNKLQGTIFSTLNTLKLWFIYLFIYFPPLLLLFLFPPPSLFESTTSVCCLFPWASTVLSIALAHISAYRPWALVITNAKWAFHLASHSYSPPHCGKLSANAWLRTQVDNSLWHPSRYSPSLCPECCEGFHVKSFFNRQRYCLNVFVYLAVLDFYSFAYIIRIPIKGSTQQEQQYIK